MEHALARRPQKKRISDEGRDEQRSLQGKETDHVRPPPLRRGSTTAGLSRAGSDTSRAIHPLIEIAQDTGGDPPDVTLLIRHRVVMSLDAFPVAAVALMVFGAHQEVERHLEGVGDLGSIERELVGRRDPRHHWQNAKPREGEIEIEKAEGLHETGIETDFLLGLTQRGCERALVALVDLAARECDLP